MNKKANLLLVSLAITIGLFIYLSAHHFSVKMGVGGTSICSINAKFNCDAAATSSFSEVAGIPVAVLGGIFTFMLFGLVLFLKFDWVDRTVYALNTTRFMLVLGAVTSVVLGIISVLIIKVACPFCAGTYILSFINLFLGWNLFSADEKFDPVQYLSTYRSHLIFLVAVPVLAWLVSAMIQQKYGLDEVKRLLPEKLAQWQASPTQSFNLQDGLIRQGTDSKVVVVEFADFKCSHCKAAAKTIESFLQGNPDVTFIFKPWPLDGICNKAVKMKGDGSRCTLAAWTLCAEKTQKRGWDVHHWIFEKQDELSGVSDLKPHLQELEKDLKIDTTALTQCSESSETLDVISRTSDEGEKAQVQGTPTIYMNGKKLAYGQFLDVLKAAADTIR